MKFEVTPTFLMFCILWFFNRFCLGNSSNGIDAHSNSQSRNQTISLSDIENVNSILKKFLLHFKNSNASSEPLPIPDPFHRADREYGPPLMIKTTNVTVRGASNMKMKSLNSDLVAMKINFDLHLPNLSETGHYVARCFFVECSGRFFISIVNAHWNCRGALKITQSGHVAVSKIELDLKHRDEMNINVENAGLFGAFVNNFGNTLFEGMKSNILSVISLNIENHVNEQLRFLQITLPNSIPPIDTITIEARKLATISKFDPYPLPDFSYTSATSLFLMQVSEIYIRGIASFYRTGNVSVSVPNDNLQFRIILNFGTDLLRGDGLWEIGMSGIYSISGNIFFYIDYVDIFLTVDQSFDLSKAPVIADMNVQVGNIQMHLDGYSIFEYAIEFVVNLISNWIRNHIIILFKTKIIYEVQCAVDKINMEDIIFKYFINDISNPIVT